MSEAASTILPFRRYGLREKKMYFFVWDYGGNRDQIDESSI